MISLLNQLFADQNEKELRRLVKILEIINAMDSWASSLSDEQFPVYTEKYKERLQQCESLDDLLPEAFALAREAVKRQMGIRLFDIQILGAIVLHQGRIAEIQKGEGKTLIAALPAYLNALTSKGVHIVTVNDYLAHRDRNWMGPIYEHLGLSVGLIVQGLEPAVRQEAYSCDITYVNCNELGFDYLRDNMALYKEDVVQRDKYYAIIEEIDSILIDKIETSLIIEGRVESKEEYGRWKNEVEHLIRKQGKLVNDLLNQALKDLEAGERDEAAEKLLLVRRATPKNRRLMKVMKEPGVEKLVERTKQRLMTEKRLNHLDEELYYVIDEATRLADIKDKGYRELERVNPQLLSLLKLDKDEAEDIDELDQQEQDTAGEHRHYFDQLIKAYSLFERDVDYVVQDGKVVIVDEFTGRLMPGRRYSEGLHQAIEAKEGVEVQAASRTVASITFQNYFRMYDKISGMTGTAQSVEIELRSIYGIDVVAIPPNKPLIRKDLPDRIYKTEKAKYKGIIKEILEYKKRGQPVIVGTLSDKVTKMLSAELKKMNIKHNVIYFAKYNQKDYIAARAGRKGVVTILPIKMSREIEIELGGNACLLLVEKLNKEFGQSKANLDYESSLEWEKRYENLIEKAIANTQNNKTEVIALGGLHVIGTEKHKSRRLDEQMRSLAGHQGEPGTVQFFVSLEDALIRFYRGDQNISSMKRFFVEKDMGIEHPKLYRRIENIQKKAEVIICEIRKNQLKYNDFLFALSETIYQQRRRVFESESMKDAIDAMIEELIDRLVHLYTVEVGYLGDKNARALLDQFENLFAHHGSLKLEQLTGSEKNCVKKLLLEKVKELYKEREVDIKPDIMRELERAVFLKAIDLNWMFFIDVVHDLSHEIPILTYARKNPLVIYKPQITEMFENTILQIQEEVVRAVFQAGVTEAPRRESVANEVTAISLHMANLDEGNSFIGSSENSDVGQQDDCPQKVEPVTVGLVGRNEPCPCGSGKKHKKCCGN